MKSVDAIAKKSVFFRTDVKRAISKIRCGVAFARGVQDLASCHVQVRRASHAESDKKNKVARSRRPGRATDGAWFATSCMHGHDWEKREDCTERGGPHSTRGKAVNAALRANYCVDDVSRT